MKKLLIVLFMGLVLVACDDYTVENLPSEVDESDVEEVINTEKNEVEADEAVEEEPQEEVEEDLGAIQLAQLTEYTDTITPLIDGLGEVVILIGDLAEMVGEDTNIIYNQDYMNAVYGTGILIEEIASQVDAIDTGGDSELEDAHFYMQDAMGQYLMVAELFPQGIEELDPYMLDEALYRMEQAEISIIKATELIDEMFSNRY